MVQSPYENAKFYTPMRHRLEGMDLPASVLACFIAAHTICDADTGRFYRDDVTFRTILQLPKSTISYAFKRLQQSSLIEPTEDGGYVIVGYEDDRLDGKGYFRISNKLLVELPKMVSHHHPRVILFALELLDRARVDGSEIVYSIRTLIKDRKLGSCPARVYNALQLLGQLTMWAQVPNATDTGYNLHFYPTKPETSDANQDRYRALHGKVSSETKRGYVFAKGTEDLSWRELARTTRIILNYGMEAQLSDDDMCRVASLFGAYCARNAVRRRVAYLRRALPDLVNYAHELAS